VKDELRPCTGCYDNIRGWKFVHMQDVICFVGYRFGHATVLVIIYTQNRAEDDSGALFFRQTSHLGCEKIWMHLSSIGRVPELGVRLYFLG